MVRIYRWLIRLSPAALRREYGAAREETFAHRLSDARTLGWWACARVCVREFAGLIGMLLSERCGTAARRRRQQQRSELKGKAGSMEAMTQELRQATRRLVRTPSFTLATIATLAL